MKYPFQRGIAATTSSSDREEDEGDSPGPDYGSTKGWTLHSGFHRIEILKWYECEPTDEFIVFWDTFSAYSFLRKFVHETFNMKILRNVVAETAYATTSIYRLGDDEIVQRLAWKIARGEIRLVSRQLKERLIISPAEEEEELAPAREEPVAAVVETAAPIETPVPVPEPVIELPVEPVVVEPPTDYVEAQAATLKDAAESGAPFCENCEQAAKEPAESAEVAVEPSPVHAKAQAKTLKDAAKSGSAFCEKCE